ncbi:MAG: excinuclease ABC subunit UvrC [bacterium]
MNNNIMQEKLNNLPKNPGVYLYRNIKGNIIYVGKAINLKNRVTSYFRGNHDIKTVELVKNISDFEWIVVGSEIEALLLEAELIKRYKPHYNIDWKDDKNYCYIKITKEDYPRIYIVRQVVDDKADYLGPYIDANAVRMSLKVLRKAFPFCTCTLNPDSTCLYYHLNLCHGHGSKYISKVDYQSSIRGLVNFLSGKREEVMKDLRRLMKMYSNSKQFELAADIRNRIAALERMRYQHVIEEKREVELDKALITLKTVLALPQLPRRIECYDISNIFGRNAVGSMVVFKDGIPSKNDYRRFEIKTVKRIDDYAMHREVQKRRFANLIKGTKDSFKEVPDLVIIDGGKGQLSSVMEIVEPLHLQTKFVGLAKRLEELVVLTSDGSFDTVQLELNSEAYFLVQRIRDEAHRFAITYHRNLRSKELTSSSLDNVPGIGPITKKKLMTKFGSLDMIKAASEEELSGMLSKKVIQKLKEYL